MEAWWQLIWPIGLVLLSVLAWGSNFVTLPGNWIAAALVIAYYLLAPEQQRISLGRTEVIAAVGFAVLGELLEFAAAALGAKKAGGSRRATMMAVVGSMIGAMAGALLGLPIPIFGTIVAALLFGALGATAGAVLGEWMSGKQWKETIPVGHAAFWGRLLGTVGKICAGIMILLVVIVGVCV
ncbi:hypothetical protein Poly24_53550 [Rosistilla carotiformis]|uniref:DUF456 domain-containing protein n=1 Tax=Rosistilla carotiformis TaxID=2528017 RepID=A0A518K1D7_9BACT|nr:DUF456 domain-containing protein [Rosistilla carotiformis]QDV71616.1 hypothetical protein Poly24_53550 [Rosistilla carotiformis]